MGFSLEVGSVLADVLTDAFFDLFEDLRFHHLNKELDLINCTYKFCIFGFDIEVFVLFIWVRADVGGTISLFADLAELAGEDRRAVASDEPDAAVSHVFLHLLLELGAVESIQDFSAVEVRVLGD